MTNPIRVVKPQYFLAYAPLGSLGPLLPIFLKHGKGFAESQFGILIALTAISMVVTPVLLAFLADTRIDSRRLLAGAYLIAAASLVAISFAGGVVAVSALYLVYSLAIMPTLPLTDALFFSIERAAESEGRRVSPYQFVRIWGTIGFIVPSLLLYFASPQATASVLFWSLGSFAKATWSVLWLPCLVVSASIVVILAFKRQIMALQAGDETAHTLGVNVPKLRLNMLLLCSLITAILVATCGGIGFVGLMIPHTVRMLFPGRQPIILTALVGGLFMVWIDVLARCLDAIAV